MLLAFFVTKGFLKMFSTNLKKYRILNNLTQIELALKLSKKIDKEVTGTNIRSYENGTNPKLEVIEFFADILNIPIQYLFDDSKKTIIKITQKEILKDSDSYKKILVSFDENKGIIKIPFYNNENIEEYIHVDSFYSIGYVYKNKEIVALKNIGDSMRPYLDDSDIILFTPSFNRQKPQDNKYVILKNNTALVRNLTFKIDGTIVISPENNFYEKEEINTKNIKEDQFKILGVVISRILKS